MCSNLLRFNLKFNGIQHPGRERSLKLRTMRAVRKKLLIRSSFATATKIGLAGRVHGNSLVTFRASGSANMQYRINLPAGELR